MPWKQRLKLMAAILCIVAGLVPGLLLVGREARMVDVITLFAAGFGGGASLVSFIFGAKGGRGTQDPSRPNQIGA